MPDEDTVTIGTEEVAEVTIELDADSGEETSNIIIENSEVPEELAETSEKEETFGKRAEKRIRGLVAGRKDLERQLVDLQTQNQSQATELETARTQQNSYEVSSLDETEARVTAELETANRDYKQARLADDYDAEAEAMARIAAAKTQGMAVDARRKFVTKDAQGSEDTKVQEFNDIGKEAPRVPPELDQRTQDWIAKNTWFTEAANPTSSQEDREMVQMAQRLDQYATQVLQLDPAQDADEYWKVVDDGLTKQYPHRFTETGEESVTENKPRQMMGGKRSPAAKKQTVKLSKEQMAFAARHKIDPKKLAAEQHKLNAR